MEFLSVDEVVSCHNDSGGRIFREEKKNKKRAR